MKPSCLLTLLSKHRFYSFFPMPQILIKMKIAWKHGKPPASSPFLSNTFPRRMHELLQEQRRRHEKRNGK